MAYFQDIVTKGVWVPNFASAAQQHREALNAYIKTPGPNGKEREVKHMASVQSLRNDQEIVTTTFLCCDEDEEYEEAKK